MIKRTKTVLHTGHIWLPMLIVSATIAFTAIISYAVVNELTSGKASNTNTAANSNVNELRNVNGGVACTMEAKQCPDGSYVGRVPPDCQFEACPNENTNSSPNLESNTNKNEGIFPPVNSAANANTNLANISEPSQPTSNYPY